MFAAAGGAVERLARDLAVNMAPIRVNAVGLGAVDIEAFGKTLSDEKNMEAMLSMFREESFTKTVARREDVAETYMWCMHNDFVMGRTVQRKGGVAFA